MKAGRWSLLLGVAGLLFAPCVFAEKNIEIDWDSGAVTVEENVSATEESAAEKSGCPPCGPEVDRLEDIVRKQQRLLQRQQNRINELERELDGERRINIRLNQMLKGLPR